METLRCPTCLNLVDGGPKRCSECGSRLKVRRRSAPPAEDTFATRPRALIERELQARLEAQTAARFRERRRAAKRARQIAALPDSLFETPETVDAGNGAWPSTPVNPVVIDLPVSVVRDVKSPVHVECDVVTVDEPQPLALVAPVIEIAEVAGVEPIAEPIAAPDGPPRRSHRRTPRLEHRWALRRISRAEPETVDPPAAAEAVALQPEPTVFPAPVLVVEAEPDLEPIVQRAAPEPVIDIAPDPVVEHDVPEPVVGLPEPEPIVDIEPEPEPEVEPEPVVVARPDPALERAPASVAPKSAVDWQPSESLWARSVFASRNQPQRVATWPRPHEPAPTDDLARDYIDAQVADPARND